MLFTETSCRWFTKLPVDQPVQRCSWGIEDWEAFYAPEDVPRSVFAKNPQDCTVEDLQLRCDFQTLRRLPVSGAVVFNFKAVFTPFKDLASEPHVPALLHKVVTGGQKVLIDYKMEPHVQKIVSDTCAEWAKMQLDEGIVPKDWEVGTLEEHPYFPGWKEMMFGGIEACPMR
jgi:hypothetical protein